MRNSESDDDDLDAYDDSYSVDEFDDSEPMVDCPYCGSEMLESAVQCPACGGYPSREDQRSAIHQPMWVVLTVILCLTLILAWLF